MGSRLAWAHESDCSRFHHRPITIGQTPSYAVCWFEAPGGQERPRRRRQLAKSCLVLLGLGQRHAGCSFAGHLFVQRRPSSRCDLTKNNRRLSRVVLVISRRLRKLPSALLEAGHDPFRNYQRDVLATSEAVGEPCGRREALYKVCPYSLALTVLREQYFHRRQQSLFSLRRLMLMQSQQSQQCRVESQQLQPREIP